MDLDWQVVNTEPDAGRMHPSSSTMRITLGQLEAFVAVVEAESFEEAARSLNLTQSTVSKRISDL